MLTLLISALSIGFIHTLLGPDHYVPFIVLAKSRHWSMIKTLIITLLCGIGHVLSAVILGVVAIAIGLSLSKLKFVESFRGEIAAWLLVSFGLVYFIWGMRNAIKKKIHKHEHSGEYLHVHTTKNLKELTPWILFIIFVFGPCEPLIPLIMYPAIQKSILNTIWVTMFFSVGTLFTMLFMVLAAVYSANKLKKVAILERYNNAIAGMIICSCGLAIKFLGV